jgi:hypothetical protein
MNAHIELYANTAIIRGVSPKTLRRLIPIRSHTIMCDDGRINVRRKQEAIGTAKNGAVEVRRGLVHRICHRLRNAGWLVTVNERTRWLNVRAARNDRHQPSQKSVLQTAASKYPFGQIIGRSSTHVAEAVIELHDLYHAKPGALTPFPKTLVVVKNQKEEKELATLLRDLGEQHVYILGKGKPQPRSCIEIGTSAVAVDGGTRHYCPAIYVGREVALHREVLDTFAGPLGSRVVRYALMHDGDRLTPQEQLNVERAFGHVIHSYVKPKATAPKVMWLPSPAPSRFTDAGSLSTARNRIIAQAAEAIKESRFGDLPGPTGRDTPPLLTANKNLMSVVVYTDSPEQARRLQELLPHWPILAAQSTVPPQSVNFAIVTEGYTMEHRLRATVIIHAAGGKSVVTGAQMSRKHRPVLVLDLVDGQSADTYAREQA